MTLSEDSGIRPRARLPVPLKLLAGVALALPLAGCPSLGPPLSPPDWILGIWSDPVKVNTWTFESGKVRYAILGDLSWRIVSQTSSDTEYKLDVGSLRIPDGNSFRFVKTSATTLAFSQLMYGIPITKLDLDKQ